MKYMFVIQSLSNGGAERVVSIISTALTEQFEEVIIVKFFSAENEYDIGERVKVINLSGGNITEYKRMGKLRRIFRLRDIILNNMPDFVIPFTYPVSQMIEFATWGLKVNVFQSIRINPAVSPANRLVRAFRDRLVYKSKCSFVQNIEQKLYFKKQYQKKIHVLSNPVSEDLFSAKPKTPGKEFIICALGRLTKQKNYDLLINAFAEAFGDDPSVKLRIYGEGVLLNYLTSYIGKLGLDSKISIIRRTNNVKAVFEASDMYVLSSDWEGMPNALIEAMASNVPCISTDCPTGPSDLIKNGFNGLLVPVNDKRALANSMLKMRSMPFDERRIISSRGRETVKNKCSRDFIAKQMISICEAVIIGN